jgi:hypothetical protein
VVRRSSDETVDCSVLHGRRDDGAPDAELDGDDVALDVDPVELAVQVGGQLAHEGHQVAQVLGRRPVGRAA